MQARVVQHIRAGDRDQALAVMLFGTFFPRAQALARPLAPLAARVGRKLGDLDDLATTIEAGDEINLALSGTSLVAPALIVAGARDRFYSRPRLEEKQRLIPDSVLHLFSRPGHLTAMTATGIPAAGGHPSAVEAAQPRQRVVQRPRENVDRSHRHQTQGAARLNERPASVHRLTRLDHRTLQAGPAQPSRPGRHFPSR